MGNSGFRTFDPAKEAGAEPPQPRGNSLRDRIMRGGSGAGGAPTPSPSGYVHQPQAVASDAHSQPVRETEPEQAQAAQNDELIIAQAIDHLAERIDTIADRIKTA